MKPNDLTEGQRIELARQTPAGLAWVMSGGKWHCAPHLEVLNRKLMDLAAGRITRLAVFMPPRHGKSQLCSRYFPAWFLGTFPDQRVIQAGYGSAFASTWGRHARNTINAANSMGIFNSSVDPSKSSANEWDILDREGGMYAVGVGGGITGRGADLLTLDDVVKSREEAESPTYREKTLDWYTDDAYTRLHPGGRILLVATRWHHQDLPGTIIERDKGRDKWEVLCFPAIAEEADILGREPGEALWPERYPLAALDDISAELGSYGFAALYQQRPAPREGGMFKREWFKIKDAVPAGGRIIRFWDLAGTAGGGDWTAGVKLVAYPNGTFAVLDVRRDRLSPSGVRNLLLSTAQLDGYDCMVGMFQDPGQAGKDQMQEYSRILSGYPLFVMSTSGNPDLRAESFAAQCEAGNVILSRGPWNEAFIEELCAFTSKSTGGVDDQVDGISGGFAQLTREADEYSTYLSAEEIIPGFAPVRLGAA